MSKRSEWDVLKEHHRFVRDDEEPADVSWEDRLARAYESKLFKEFALVGRLTSLLIQIDLKHYKSKKFALRWRTATEVVDGIGEETCGSLRCEYHRREGGRLRSFELPFAYEEGGLRKETLVKVRLCSRCGRKLSWRPEEGRVEREERGEERRRARKGDERETKESGRDDTRRRREDDEPISKRRREDKESISRRRRD